MTPDAAVPGRRPIATRGHPWAIAAAAWLARRGVSPNAISMVSILCAAVAGAALAAWSAAPAWAAIVVLALAAMASRAV